MGRTKYTPNDLLRAERKKHSWTQSELAKKIGASTNDVSRWERGEALPSPYYSLRLCEIFDKSPKELGLNQENTDHVDTILRSIRPSSPSFPSNSVQPISRGKATLLLSCFWLFIWGIIFGSALHAFKRLPTPDYIFFSTLGAVTAVIAAVAGVWLNFFEKPIKSPTVQNFFLNVWRSANRPVSLVIGLSGATIFLAVTYLITVPLLGIPPGPVVTATPIPTFAPIPLSAACTQRKPATGKLSLTGLAYSPYHTGQDPTGGIFPSDEEVNADMPTIASLTNYIRIYSSTGPANAIIQAASADHVCVALGISLGRYPDTNAAEMMAGIKLASNAAVRVIVVGNEVLLRGDMSEGQLIAAIEEVRAHLSRPVPITVADDFNQWLAHPNLAKHVDFITVHIYPFWNGVPIDDAIQFLDMKYRQVQAAFPGKPIIIGETGWPDAGPSHGLAVPSAENQARYLRAFINWAQSHQVQYFYFEAFDEGWKTSEGGVGTHWGLYQIDGHVKSQFKDVLPEAAPITIRQRSFRDVYVGSGLETPFALGIDTSQHQYGWLTTEDGVLTLDYPEGQSWGAVLITAGWPVPPGNRPSLDLSAYHSLVVDLRTSVRGQCIRIGIKDRTQPDNGSEITVQECLTTQWSTITLPLKEFADVDLTHLYVVFEIVFQGTSGFTVELRNIRYSPM